MRDRRPDGLPRYCTVKDFAGLLGVHPNTVYRWAARGSIRGVSRIPGGRTIRIDLKVAIPRLVESPRPTTFNRKPPIH